MKGKIFTAAMALALLFSLNACCTLAPGKIVYSEKMIRTVEEAGIKASIHITKNGDLLFYNAKGQPMEQCVLPKPGTSSKQSTTGSPVCKGMTKDSAVTSVESIPILRTNSQTCMTFGPDASGTHYEVCW